MDQNESKIMYFRPVIVYFYFYGSMICLLYGNTLDAREVVSKGK